MAKSSMKIVLVDPLGDILFSGDSLIGSELDDARPAALSGIYPRAEVTAETDVEADEAATLPAPSRTRVA